MQNWEEIAGKIATTILGGLASGGAIWKYLEYRQSLRKQDAEREKSSDDADDRLIGRYEARTAALENQLEAQRTRHEAERERWYERERQLIQTNAEQQMEIKLLTRRVEELSKEG